MTSTRLRILFLMAFSLAGLLSCKSMTDRIDSRTPTVSQQDAYDVSWGLPPRKSRGNPKHYYQYRKDAYDAPPTSSAPAASAAPAPVPSAAPAAPVAPISPNIPATLR